MTIELKPGDRIAMTNKKSGLRLEGRLSFYGVENLDLRLEGTYAPNTFFKKDWVIEALPPEIEDGLYLDGMSVYRVRGEAIKYVGASFDEIRDSLVTREQFADDVVNGRAIRISDLQGNPVPALKNKE